MFKLGMLGLSVAWKTGLIVAGSVLVGGALVEMSHVVSKRNKEKQQPAPAFKGE